MVSVVGSIKIVIREAFNSTGRRQQISYRYSGGDHEVDENGRNRSYAGPEPGIDAEFGSKKDERADDDDSAAEGDDAGIRTTHVP